MTKLGQHFLINKDKIKKIVEALELKEDDTIIEIGPGHGELTLELRIDPPGILRKKNAELRIIAVEKDEKLAEVLQKKFAPNKNIKIIKGDILKILTKPTQNPKLITHNYKVVGNIPYYITGKLLRILSKLEYKPSLIVLTIQKEVAQRVCAQPPKMNLLAASVQFWAEPKIIGYISRKDFWPAPEVDSAIITLTPIAADNKQIAADKYYRLIKALFKQPRKTILNNLINIKRSDLPKIDVNIRRSNLQKLLQKIGINPSHRPQNLSIEQILELSTLF